MIDVDLSNPAVKEHRPALDLLTGEDRAPWAAVGSAALTDAFDAGAEARWVA